MSTDLIQTFKSQIQTFESGISRRNLIRGSLAGLALVSGSSLLGGCTSGSPTSEPSTKGVDGVPKTEPAPATPNVFYKDKYVGPRASQKKPFADGSKTFKIVVPQSSESVGDWNKNAFSQWIEQRTGVKVEYQTVVTTDGDMTKVNAMVSAGDLPDAFMNIPFTRDQISLYGGQGIFVPLDDYIETYAVEIKQAEASYPNLPKLGRAIDGKTYAFPLMSDCFHCCVSPGRAFISQSMVDKVGGKVPTTTAELRTMLKAFKDSDVNGHGNVVPLVAGASSPIDRFFMNAFLYNPGEPWLRLDQGKVDFVASKPEWREGLRFLRSLHDDGTLTPDVFTLTDEAVLKLGNTPGYERVGMARTFHWGVFVDIAEGQDARWKDYVPIPALEGPAGVRYAGWDHYVFYQSGLIVTSKCSDPGTLVQWADYQVELEAWMNGYAGEKGKVWDFAKQGDLGIDGQQATYEITKSPAPVGTTWGGQGAKYASNDWRLSQTSDPKNPNYEAALYEATLKPYAPYQQPIEFQLPPLVFDESAAATNADTETSIAQHVTTSLAEFATGKQDINDDAAWNDYVAEFEKMGMSTYLGNYQAAYDTYQRNG